MLITFPRYVENFFSMDCPPVINNVFNVLLTAAPRDCEFPAPTGTELIHPSAKPRGPRESGHKTGRRNSPVKHKSDKGPSYKSENADRLIL